MSKIENDLTNGKVITKLVFFTIPFLASTLIQSFYNVADMLIVGNFCGIESLSGVNIGGQITFLLTNTVVGLSVGATVLIGQYIGAGNRVALKRVNSTIITMLIIGGFGITIIMLLLKKPILILIHTPPEAYGEADKYLTATVSGIVFIFGYNALSAILRGMGNSKQPFYFILAACIINIILDLLFVGVFKWAAFGAALATVIAQAMSVFLCIHYMIKNGFDFDFKPRSFKIYKDQLRLIFKIGLPTCIQNSVTTTSFMFVSAIVNTVGGVSASAAVGAIGRFNSFAFMPANAISTSVSSMTAQNLGAGKTDRAIESCLIGIVLSVFITYTFFIFVRVFPQAVLSIFGDDTRMIQDGILYLGSLSFDFLFIPFIFCFNGFLIGGGHTSFTLANSLFSSVFLRIPVSYLFGITFGWGLKGIGMAAPVASTGVLLVIIGYLFTGKWKRNIIQNVSSHN
jgi:putative MATE family efflux protein